MRKLLSIILLLAILITTFVPMAVATPEAEPVQFEEELLAAYVTILDYAASIGISLEYLSFELFQAEFEKSNPSSLAAFIEQYLDTLRLQAIAAPEGNASGEALDEPPFDPFFGGGDLAYYYNTGLYLPPQATYGYYLLLPNIRKGDIIHEDAGGPFGLLGHSAIVEGRFFCTTRRIFFVRLIEAIEMGVVRSILDDRRIDERLGSVIRVTDATPAQIHDAVQFIVGQLGKPYPIISSNRPWHLIGRNALASSTTWYCSELVWAAYLRQGINIDGRLFGTVWPRNIRDHRSTEHVPITGTFPGGRFTDIADLPPAAVKDAIIFLADNGITVGTSAYRFSPQQVLTRAEVVTFLYRMAGEPRVTGMMPFLDVPRSAWFRDAVLWAHNHDIVMGTSPIRFSPNTPVTREQVATFLYRHAKEHGFSVEVYENALDALFDRGQISPWALTPMQWAFTEPYPILVADDLDMCRPHNHATRAEVAYALHALTRR